jgi:predicted MFS family arabinose efflux permease
MISQSAARARGAAYRNYVLGVLCLAYVVNVMDRSVLGALLEPIRHEFSATDTQLGLLGGLAFALFYATLGVPIAALADRTSRRNVIAACAALWSIMTALCGAAGSFITLLAARIGTAVGEAGGTPPSHALISDYFPLDKRATALSIFALGVPLGGMLGNFIGGWGNELFGWRAAFVLTGLPGVALALLIRFTVREPVRGQADRLAAQLAKQEAPSIRAALSYLWHRPSFRHMSLAAALHSVVWYAGSSFNNSFFIRVHHMSTGEAGSWVALLLAIGGIGTLLGGYLADSLSTTKGDRRWYMWVPGYATLAMVPFQFSAYLAPSLWAVIPSFAIMLILGSMFFGPSFAMSQGLAPLRMRAVATSLVLFVQTLIGLGLGPFLAGVISDHLRPTVGAYSLAYGLVSVGLVNIWAAIHYFRGARTLRADLDSALNLTGRTRSVRD